MILWYSKRWNIPLIIFSSLFPSALAASGGQLPLSSLEGGSKVMLGASGGQAGGLPSSLFLNHPALLHMGQNPGAGLVSAAVAKASQPSPFPSASSISPTPCSPSPCSSPASSCSSSEMAHSPPSLGGAKIEWPRQGPIREEEEGGNRNLAFHTKAISFSLFCALLPLFYFIFFFCNGSLPLSLPVFRCQKYTEWKMRERGRERNERGEKGGKDWNQKSLSIQTDGEEATWDLFVNNMISTWHLSTLSLWGKTHQWRFNKETEETAESHVEVHKPKMTNDNFTIWQRNGGKDKKNGGQRLHFPFFFWLLFRKSCGSKGRGVGRISLNQKFTWGGGGGGIHNDKKKEKEKKKRQPYQNPKYQKYGEKSFIQRTCKYWSYPGPGLYCYCYLHTHTNTHTSRANPSRHQFILSVLAYELMCLL